jgi:methyltransferase family protein
VCKDRRVEPESKAPKQMGRRPRLRKLLGTWRPPSFSDLARRAPFTAVDERPDEMPAPDPVRDRQIDDALDVLKSVPFEELQRRGWHFQPNHYYWPLNDISFLRRHPDIWLRPSVPADIEWDLDGEFRLLEEITPYFAELVDVPAGPLTRAGEFVWENASLLPGDARVYYGILRKLKPRRVVEVGAGWSSLLMAQAVSRNARACEVTLIEPDPPWDVLGELPTDWELVEDRVQFADTAIFERLSPGDVLFYDGSHCIGTGSDVNWIFFEVLPRLAPGVWIHVHDLAWPWDYPWQWILDEGLSWNEQYFVQAFLMNNDAYRVRLAVAMLWAHRQPEITALVGEPVLGGSLWIEKVVAE